MPSAKSALSAALAALGFVGSCVVASPALAGSPGLDAIEEFRNPQPNERVIENRFFLKGGRFEVSPFLGYVPNNPFAKRYVGGLLVGYHFNETFSAEGMLSYSPDLGQADLKGLTDALVYIAHTGPGGDSFQQPLDKTTLSATFGGTWSPIYGKINLVGETVLNFDLYGSAGIGILSKVNYFARWDAGNLQAVLEGGTNEVKLTPTVGIGAKFFLNQTMALKLDARSAFFLDNKPQYNADVPVDEQRLYNNFVASAGLSFFFPKMKPRLYNF